MGLCSEGRRLRGRMLDSMEGSPSMRIFAVVSIAVLGLGCSNLPWQEPTTYADCPA